MRQDSARGIDWLRVGSLTFGTGPTIVLFGLVVVVSYTPTLFFPLEPRSFGPTDLSDTPMGKLVLGVAMAWGPLTALGIALWVVRARADFVRFSSTRAAALRRAPYDRP